MKVSYRTNRIVFDGSFKGHVEAKLKKIETYVDRFQRLEVSASPQGHGPSRQVKIELAVSGRGPIVRAEAIEGENERAFDKAYDRLLAQLRRKKDRRKDYHGHTEANGL